MWRRRMTDSQVCLRCRLRHPLDAYYLRKGSPYVPKPGAGEPHYTASTRDKVCKVCRGKDRAARGKR